MNKLTNEPIKKYFGDIVDVKEAYRFQPERLEAYLADWLPGFAGPLTVRQFEGGQSNPTYILDTPDRSYVLRRRPPGATLASAHAVDREFRILSALHDQGFPVPEPLVYEDNDEIVGSSFYVMAHVAGRIFFDPRMPDLTKDERTAVYDSVNETLARLHNLDPNAIGLEGYGRSGNYFERQIGRWSKQYRQSETRSIPAMERLIDWLPTAMPPEDPQVRIVHGDYSFHNIIIHPTEPRVVAVLDWELSTTGDAMGDVMYHAMEWYRPPGIDARGTLLGDDTLQDLGIPLLDEYLARYFERCGRPIPGNMAFYRAFNLFRVAGIWQGIVARAHAGIASGKNAMELDAKIEPMAEFAWAEARNG